MITSEVHIYNKHNKMKQTLRSVLNKVNAVPCEGDIKCVHESQRRTIHLI